MSTTDQTRMRESQTLREAAVNAVEAKNTADAAQAAASAVTTLAEGLITRSPLPPSGDGVADGALWLEYGTEGVITHQWDAGSESWETPSADPVMLASAIVGQLAAGVIDTTEVTVKSGDSGARMQMLGNLLRFFNSAGAQTAEIGGNDGHAVLEKATIRGRFESGSGLVLPENLLAPEIDFYNNALSVLHARIYWNDGLAIVTESEGVEIQGQEDVHIASVAGSVRIDDAILFEPTLGPGSAAPFRAELGLGESTGPLGVGFGGTGVTTAAAERNRLGLGNTTGALPVANGGTGVTTAAAERNRLGLGNTTGALPVANGGTGATTAQVARQNLGVPHAEAAGVIASLPAAPAGGNTGTVTVALPAGRFSQNPITPAPLPNNGRLTPQLVGISPTSIAFIFHNWTSVAVPAGANARWHAIQMTPTSAAG